MANIEGLKADPAFQKLAPDRQQALLQHLGGVDSSGSGGLGAQIQQLGHRAEQGYEQNIAQPATQYVTQAEDYVGIPQWAQKPIAETVVPQSLTAAGLDVASMALPELKAGRVLGDAAGPIARFVGSRLGRMGTMGGIGAGLEAATGTNWQTGLAQGALGEAGAQLARGAGGMITRRLGKGAMLRDTTADLGAAMQKSLPWLGKLKTTQDFADNFVHGGAYNKAMGLLQHEKGEIARGVKGVPFKVPVVDPATGSVAIQSLSFDQADQAITRMQRQAFLPAGGMRSGAYAPDWNKVANEARDRLAQQLDKFQSGQGAKYLTARSRLDAAITLGGHPNLQRGGVFRHPEIFDTETRALNQPRAIEQFNKHSTQLQRSTGKANVESWLDALRRGAKGEVADIPSKGEEKARVRAGVSMMGHPHVTAHPGRSYTAIGKTPMYYDPPHGPVEGATQNIISALRQQSSGKPELGPGAKALDTSRFEHLAPTPSATERAGDVNKDLHRGKLPKVHRDLTSGRLSLDETNKLLSHASDSSEMAMVKGVPLKDLMDAVEVANDDEKRQLLPLVKQRLMAELPQEQNKTLQASLSRRFKQLQQSVA